jgi:hypothetical protein
MKRYQPCLVRGGSRPQYTVIEETNDEHVGRSDMTYGEALDHADRLNAEQSARLREHIEARSCHKTVNEKERA